MLEVVPELRRAEPVPATRELTRVSDTELLTMIAAEAEMREEDDATRERADGGTPEPPHKLRRA